MRHLAPVPAMPRQLLRDAKIRLEPDSARMCFSSDSPPTKVIVNYIADRLLSDMHIGTRVEYQSAHVISPKFSEDATRNERYGCPAPSTSSR